VPKPTIVIVDDDRTILELLLINLQRRGYRVIPVADSREALSTIEAQRPALIILDVMMPYIDGWEILKEMRDNPVLSGTKVVMLTARGAPRDIMIGKDILGADEYLVKPFVMAEMLDIVHRMIESA
jgi:two-component system, OmpR family, alkaline phosphatase synthesis response regulator PhoP